MYDGTRVLAGECTTTFEGDRERTERGNVLVVCKPDNTVLVHDATGYQPIAWLTRAESVTLADGTLTATDGDQRLRVEADGEYETARYPTTAAGPPVGVCPACDGHLVRTDGTVRCLGCDASHGVPRDATIRDAECDCGYPRLSVIRGREFEVCIDRDCESLDEAVRAAFDCAWDCPDCGGDLRILRRGGLLAGCEQYPDCDTGWGLPAGTVVGTCDCGLPVFETSAGRRCLDTACDGPE